MDFELTKALDLPLSGRTQLRDDAAAHIREVILSGQVAPGTQLRLAPLAERIGASVTPVREALLLLARDGWVTLEPNRGFRVAPIRRGDLVDAYLIYGHASGLLVERAAAKLDEAHIAALRAVDAEIHSLQVPPPGSSLDAHQAAETLNYRLHGLIYAAADSPRLTWFVTAASNFVPRRFWGMVPGWYKHNRNGHTSIIDALEARDGAKATRLMHEHIEQAEALLLFHLDSIAFWAAPTDAT
jgi:DNA-binding GntR family transcriptional regulator